MDVLVCCWNVVLRFVAFLDRPLHQPSRRCCYVRSSSVLFCVRVLRGGAQVIQLQGDQRKNVLQFLTQEKLVKKEFIKIHGF